MLKVKDSSRLWMILILSFMFITGLNIECWSGEIKYPTRMVQIVVPYPPGAMDTAIRPFTDRMPDYLGQSFSFNYKPGAAGSIGASFVAKSRPDGYTLLVTSPAPVLQSPLTKELDYKLEDFVPICRIADYQIVLAVKGDSPWKTVKDVIEAAKKNPGKITYSSAGVFGTTHIPVELFQKAAGIQMTHVPCAGTAPAVSALLGGHVTMTSSTFALITPHFKSGALRPIAVFNKERSKQLPNVPTFTEAGYPVVLTGWYGIMAPKGTPVEVINTFYGACKKIVNEHRAAIEGQMENMSLLLNLLSPEEYGKELQEEKEMMRKLIKEIGNTKK